MKLVATRGLTYGTRHMQAGEPFKTSDSDGAMLLATGQATIATRADKQRQAPKMVAPVPIIQPEAAAVAASEIPAEPGMAPTSQAAIQPAQSERRPRRRTQEAPAAD